MADKTISDLEFAPGSVNDVNTLFVVMQNGASYKLTGSAFYTAMAAMYNAHGAIASIEKTGTSGLVDTYTITFADHTTTTFTVTNGNGVTAIKQYFARSTSGTTAPTSGWSTSKQTLTSTYKYLWSYFSFTTNNQTIETTKAVIGAYGDTGLQSYVHIRYADSCSGTPPLPPSDSSMGTVASDWMGIYTGTASTAPTTRTSYTWFKIKGDTGDPATLPSGGVTVTYQRGASDGTRPTGTWQNTIPTVAPEEYIWTRTIIQFNTGNPITFYTYSRQGRDGAGSPGTSTPLPDSPNGTTGTSSSFSREDHRHPKKEPYNSIFDEAQIIGHRANSIATFNEYRMKGIRFVEADITITSDNVPLLSHDDTFTVGGNTYRISTMTYSAVVATGKEFDTLANLLMNCKRYNIALYLDIKNGSTSNITALYNLVKEWGMLTMTVFGSISTSSAIVNALCELDSNLIFDYSGSNTSTVDTAIAAIPLYSLIIMHYDIGSTTPSQQVASAVKYAHQKGLKSYAWTVDSSSVSSACFDIGMDYVMSNTLVNNEGWSRTVARTYTYDNVVVGANSSIIFERDISLSGYDLIGVTGIMIEDGSEFNPSTNAGSGWSYICSFGVKTDGITTNIRIGNLNTEKPMKLVITLNALYGTNS